VRTYDLLGTTRAVTVADLPLPTRADVAITRAVASLALAEQERGRPVPLEDHNGSAAVVAQALGEVKQQLTGITAEQRAQRDLLTRFDERQKSWATKAEVAHEVAVLNAALTPVAAQAAQAHVRIDNVVLEVQKMGVDVSSILSKIDQVRGGSFVLGKAGAWAFGIAAVVIAGFVGHFVS